MDWTPRGFIPLPWCARHSHTDDQFGRAEIGLSKRPSVPPPLESSLEKCLRAWRTGECSSGAGWTVLSGPFRVEGPTGFVSPWEVQQGLVPLTCAISDHIVRTGRAGATRFGDTPTLHGEWRPKALAHRSLTTTDINPRPGEEHVSEQRGSGSSEHGEARRSAQLGRFKNGSSLSRFTVRSASSPLQLMVFCCNGLQERTVCQEPFDRSTC